MSELASWLTFPVLILEAVLGVLVGYLVLLSVAALFAKRSTSRLQTPQHRFAILIPAHNEERLLPETLASLAKLDYPEAMFDIHVVADNCTDRTAELARENKVFVYERFNTDDVGKGFALNWLMEQIALKADTDYDAYIIFDADTIATPAFLSVMDARLAHGEKAIQGYYAVRDPDRSWSVALRYAALAVLHYLRPLGRSVLGGTTGLKGNGMCFSADIMRRFKWSGSLTEDIEFHTTLVLAGERVTFAPDAMLEAEMPGTLQGSQIQNQRWERGRLQMLRQSIGKLVAAGLKQRRFAPFDALMEHLIPPTSILTALVGLCLLAGIVLGYLGGGWTTAWVGVMLLAGEGLYLFLGLLLAKAPARVWLALIYAPVLLIWKVGLYLRVLVTRDRQGWVRTER